MSPLRALIPVVVGGLLVLVGAMLPSPSIVSTDAGTTSGVGEATLRLPLVTLRSGSLLATPGDLVRLEVRVPGDTRERRLDVRLPAWLRPSGTAVIVADDGELLGEVDDVDRLLRGETDVSAERPAHIRVDLVVDDDVAPQTLGNVAVALDESEPRELAIEVSDTALRPAGNSNQQDVYPPLEDRERDAWGEGEPLEAPALNRWFDLPDSPEHPLDDQARFVALRASGAPATAAWIADAVAYPGDRLDVLVYVDNGALSEPADDELAGPEDPRDALSLRVLLHVPPTVTGLHHLTGRLFATNASPQRLAAVATVQTETPTTLRPHGDDARWFPSGNELTDNWVITDPAVAAGSLGALFGAASEDGGSRRWQAGVRYGLVVPMTVIAREEAAESLRG